MTATISEIYLLKFLGVAIRHCVTLNVHCSGQQFELVKSLVSNLKGMCRRFNINIALRIQCLIRVRVNPGGQ